MCLCLTLFLSHTFFFLSLVVIVLNVCDILNEEKKKKKLIYYEYSKQKEKAVKPLTNEYTPIKIKYIYAGKTNESEK